MYEIQSHRKLLFDLSSFASPHIRRLYSNNKPIKENNSLPSIFFYLQIGELKFFSSLKYQLIWEIILLNIFSKKFPIIELSSGIKANNFSTSYLFLSSWIDGRWKIFLSRRKNCTTPARRRRTRSRSFIRKKKKKKKKKSNILTLILLAFYGNYFPQRPLRSPPDVCC